MVRAATLVGLMWGVSLFSGCRCVPAMDKYHAVIDGFSTTDWIAWEKMYYPPWDASRAGRPDWCWSSFNRKICPCRCQQGVWGGYCDIQHYPPNHPYSYPSQAIPLHGIVLQSRRASELPEVMRTPEYPGLTPQNELAPAPVPAPVLESPPKPDSPEGSSKAGKRDEAWKPVSFMQDGEKPDAWMELD